MTGPREPHATGPPAPEPGDTAPDEETRPDEETPPDEEGEAPAGRRRWRSSLTIAGTAAALIGALLAEAAYPSYEERFRPVTSDGSIGRTVRTADFDIRVDGVDVAESLIHGDYQGQRKVNIEVVAQGVFVVVTATVTSRRIPMKIAGAYLAGADGTRTVVTDRVTLRSVDPVGASTYDAAQLLDNSSDALQPLLPTRVRLAFDVPPSRVRGARLWVSAGRLEWKGDLQAEDWFRPQARVDLGIGKARARELLDSAVRNLSVEEGP